MAHSVRRLKAVCPSLGKVKIAQCLAHAGLHLGATTVGRMLNCPTTAATEPDPCAAEGRSAIRRAHCYGQTSEPRLARRSYRCADGDGFLLRVVSPTLPQKWPFSYWLAVVVDHYSRRAMGVTAVKEQPTSADVRSFWPRNRKGGHGAEAYHLRSRRAIRLRRISVMVLAKGIKPRYGAVGKHGSIAVVERFILTFKRILALAALDSLPPRGVSARAKLYCRVVQRTPAAYLAARQNAGRSLTRHVPCQPSAAI